MHRVLLAALASSVVACPPARLGAQETAFKDSTVKSAAVLPPDSAPMIVQVRSRKLPFEMRDLLMLNCANFGMPEDMLSLMMPLACVRQMHGPLVRLDTDSVSFTRGGRTIHLAARDVRKLERLVGRSTPKTIGAGVFGGIVGLTLAGMAGIGGAYHSDADFALTAGLLVTGGAALFAYHGGKSWEEMPRSFQIPPRP